MFLIAGLAAASIVLFLFFFIRRRRRTRRIELNNAMDSVLAAHGFNRRPLDGDDDDRDMAQARSSSFGIGTLSSLPSAGGRPPSGYMDEPPIASGSDPYAAYGTVHPPPPTASGLFSGRKDGYAPARTSSPPLGHNHSASSSSMGMGHVPRESAGSFEPLLAAAGMGTPSLPSNAGAIAMSNSMGPPTVPPRSPRRPSVVTVSGEDGGETNRTTTTEPLRDSASSVYSDTEMDNQLVDLLPRPLEVRIWVQLQPRDGKFDGFLTPLGTEST